VAPLPLVAPDAALGAIVVGDKTYSAPLELKAAPAQPGEFRAIFATLNVRDLDGDVTVPGAFRDGQDVRIAAWGHDWDSLPVGIGTIHADQQKAWVDGRFFLDTPQGDATYKTVKSLGALQEWSYGFEVTKWSIGQFQDAEVRFLEGLNVFECSPVMIGAGVGTHTDAIKSAPPSPNDLLQALLDVDLKAGARNSGADMERIQKVHDLMTELGAACSAPKSAQQKALRDQAADVIADLEAYVQRLAVVSPEEAWDAQEWVPGVLARAEKARQALSSVVRLATERETLHPRGLEREFRRLEAQYQVGQARNAAHGRLA
jgi:hypothetical protein